MQRRKPDFIGLGDEKSFALYTLENRFPAIIDDLVSSRPAKDSHSSALELLKEEIQGGPLASSWSDKLDPSLFDPQEIAAWQEELGPWQGQPWRALPFYLAEAFLYLRILLAAGYYDRRSSYFYSDPFETGKTGELRRFLKVPETQKALEVFYKKAQKAKEEASPKAQGELLRSAAFFMLKGNRVDLSNVTIAERGRRIMYDEYRGDLLVDQLDKMIGLLRRADRVDIILDNAGTELVADLVFAFSFLTAFPESRVVLHAKKAPTLVSDATMQDLAGTVEALRNGPYPPLGRALAAFQESARVQARDHFFWNGPRHFTAFPSEIIADLAGSDLVLIKGDANFRRIVEDRKWPYDTPLEELSSWFPASFAVLRTLKSEVASNIPLALMERLSREDPTWLVNGNWGVIHVVEKKSQKGD